MRIQLSVSHISRSQVIADRLVTVLLTFFVLNWAYGLSVFATLHTYHFFDRVLPHPNGYGWHDFHDRGILGGIYPFGAALFWGFVPAAMVTILFISMWSGHKTAIYANSLGLLLLLSAVIHWAVTDFSLHTMLAKFGFSFLVMPLLLARLAWLWFRIRRSSMQVTDVGLERSTRG